MAHIYEKEFTYPWEQEFSVFNFYDCTQYLAYTLPESIWLINKQIYEQMNE